MGDHRLWLLLEIVRGQMVVASGDEGLEIAPGASGDQPQVLCLRCIERMLRCNGGGAAGP
jgi:hypothetical protein